jgi:hypothetical protein
LVATIGSRGNRFASFSPGQTIHMGQKGASSPWIVHPVRRPALRLPVFTAENVAGQISSSAIE